MPLKDGVHETLGFSFRFSFEDSVGSAWRSTALAAVVFKSKTAVHVIQNFAILANIIDGEDRSGNVSEHARNDICQTQGA